MNHDIFITCNLTRVYNLETKDNIVSFHTDKKGIKKLQALEVEFEYRDYHKIILHKLVKEHLLAVISLVSIVLMLICSQIFVREIVFADPLEYNYEVYQTVNNHLVKRGPFYVLDTDLNSLGQELRTTYYDYAYIGLIRSGSKIIIEIAKQEVPKVNTDERLGSGDLIAKMDGYITGIEIKKGVTVITINQMVKKGTLLVSGNLLYLTDPTSRTTTLSADGLVLAKTYEYVTIEVPKTTTITGYTGDFKSGIKVTLGGWQLGQDQGVEGASYLTIKELFRIPHILNIQKITSYQTGDIVITHDQNSAKSYAISKIYYNFSLQKRSVKEVIKEIVLLNSDETVSHHIYYFLVKAIQNIAEFQSYT